MPPFLNHYSLELQEMSMVSWLHKYYDKLPFRPLECVQQAGEVLYVPTGWHHAIINLEHAVGMAVEVGDASLEFKQYAGAVSFR